MELISIIPGFSPRQDLRLLKRAEELKPKLLYTPYPAPAACRVNGQDCPFSQLAQRPLRRGDEAVLDFGRHLVGRLTLQLAAAGSHQDAPAYFQVDLAEIPGELEESPADYRGWLSPSWIQQERLHVDTLPAQVDLPRRYAFRYVRIRVLGTSPKYQLVVRGASCMAESAADWQKAPDRRFARPDIQRIYDVSLRTLADCTQQVLEDGPKRDQRLWLGDLRLQALTTYVSFGSTDLVKRCLYLFAGTRFPDGRMSANVFTQPEPMADDTYLADYALLFLPALEEYLAHTGDAEALGDLLTPGLEQADHALAHFIDSRGIVTAEAAQSAFIDWSDGLDRTAALQGVLISALSAAAALCARAGDEAREREYRGQVRRLRAAARESLWSDQEGCFLSGGQISIHSQVWLALAGAMPEGRAPGAFQKALSLPGAPGMDTPYMHHYYVMALLSAGLRQEAEAHLLSYWGSMLSAGADTFWECWDPAQPSASPYGGRIVNSFCHAWSCTPAYILETYFQKE